MNLAANSLYIIHICYLAFIEYLNRNFLICKDMNTFFDFTKGALSKRFSDSIATDFNSTWLWYFRFLFILLLLLCHLFFSLAWLKFYLPLIFESLTYLISLLLFKI